MQTLRRVALALALAGAVATIPGCAVAQPVPAPYGAGTPPPTVSAEWQEDLAPYGSWTNLPNYGNVWYPNVAPGWRPYTYGYWGWGSVGWTWFSNEPWGFTFNYGRWAWAPIGWVWVPGTVWGPAWVNWYWGNGYVGWAPLGFYGAVPFAQFVFVDDDDFGCHDTWKRYHKHPPKGGGYHTGAPPRSWVNRVSHQPIVRVSADQLPNRNFASRRSGQPNPQSPGMPTRGSGSASPGRQRGNGGSFAGRPPQSGTQNPQVGSPGSSFAPRQPGMGSAPTRPRGFSGGSPQARPPQYGSPGTTAPRGNRPGMSPYPQMAPYGQNPTVMNPPSPRGNAPGRQGGAPRAMQPAPRAGQPVPSAPRSSQPGQWSRQSMPSAPPSAPSAPSSGFTGRSMGPSGPSGFSGGSMRGWGGGYGGGYGGSRGWSGGGWSTGGGRGGGGSGGMR
jgi:hypothetical protein